MNLGNYSRQNSDKSFLRGKLNTIEYFFQYFLKLYRGLFHRLKTVKKFTYRITELLTHRGTEERVK